LLQGVAFDEWVQYNACTKVWYSSHDIMPVLQASVKKENPDKLFIIGMYDWQYNFKPLLLCKGVKKIISVRGMLHPGALTQKGFKKKIYLLLWKMLGLHKQNSFHATDEAEKGYIQDVFGKAVQVKVASNFPRVISLQPVVKKEAGHVKLVSIALISAMKNILLVLEALVSASCESLVVSSEEEKKSYELLTVSNKEENLNGGKSKIANLQSKIFTIEYNIYGPVKDEKYWEQCMAVIKKMPANVIVHYHGDIQPDKIAGVLSASHVFILPSKSENFGHALYEALSAGRPVITSNNTPWQKLEAAKAGMNVSLDSTNELQKAIGFFAAMNEVELNDWSNNARVFAEKAMDVEEIKRQYEEMFG
jgi:glycosyltransferase involved in cell wall biosynthesis